MFSPYAHATKYSCKLFSAVTMGYVVIVAIARNIRVVSSHSGIQKCAMRSAHVMSCTSKALLVVQISGGVEPLCKSAPVLHNVVQHCPTPPLAYGGCATSAPPLPARAAVVRNAVVGVTPCAVDPKLLQVRSFGDVFADGLIC